MRRTCRRPTTRVVDLARAVACLAAAGALTGCGSPTAAGLDEFCAVAKERASWAQVIDDRFDGPPPDADLDGVRLSSADVDELTLAVIRSVADRAPEEVGGAAELLAEAYEAATQGVVPQGTARADVIRAASDLADFTELRCAVRDGG